MMDIRECIQNTLNNIPDEYRYPLFEQIKELRKIEDTKDRFVKLVEFCGPWNESARMSEDSKHWDYCLSCVSCLFSAAYEPFDVKRALDFARCESSARSWRLFRNVDKSEDAYYQVH